MTRFLPDRLRRPFSLRGQWGIGLGTMAFALWLIAVHGANFSKMNGYGLVSVLGWTYFAGLTLLVVGFCVELMRPQLRSRRLLFLVIILIVFLYATASAVEPVASITDSWIHAGYIQYILVHGHPLNGFDARFSWPGAFSMAAVLTSFVGQANAIDFLRWFPLFIELAYLAPLLVIARFSGVGRRAGWLGIALYFSSNWILQDYFSPQALNFLFFLVVIAVVLACWEPITFAVANAVPGSLRDRFARSRLLLTRARIEGHHSSTKWGRREYVGALLLLAIIFLASSMSHQLTPYALIIALAGLLITRRLDRPELIILLIVLTFGWLSLGASNYWVGHLGAIFGSVGQLSSKLSSNLTSRVTGQATHLVVVKLRILLTGGLFLMGGIGFLRRSTDSRTLEVLVAAPFLLFLAQSYGGEGLLRVVLYGLPFTALLAASALLPNDKGQVRSLLPAIREGRVSRVIAKVAPATIATAILVCALVTTIVRGGNDAYDSFSAGDLAAVNYVYDHIQPGKLIGLTNYYLPIGHRGVGVVSEYIANAPSSSAKYRQIGAELLKAMPSFIILSKSEEAYGVDVAGYPQGWQRTLEASLLTHGYQVDARWSTATVLKLVGSTIGPPVIGH